VVYNKKPESNKVDSGSYHNKYTTTARRHSISPILSSLIQTVTVGFGISPNQPSAKGRQVAD